MTAGDDDTADEHQGGTLSDAVIEMSEEGCEDDCAVGEDRDDPPGGHLFDAVFVNHQVAGELQERTDAAVEENT